MGWFKAVQCIRCKSPLGTAPYYLGCPKCESEGVTCNYTTVYDLSEAYLPEAHPGAGIWSYKPFYPVYDNAREISLQEGNTPLIHLKSLGERLGLNRLYVKLSLIHISEPTRLGMISYAVFCLKKKK